MLCRWLLLAKLRQQSGDADGFVAAQSQALKLQCMLLEHVRQPDKLGAAAEAVFDRDSAPGTAARGQRPAFGATDGSAARGSGGPPAAAEAVTASASGKAASICFELAEFHRQRHQFDKVGRAQMRHLGPLHLRHWSPRVHAVLACLPACLNDACSQKRDTVCVCANAVTAQAEAAYTACLSHRHKHGAARLALARLALANGQVCTDMYAGSGCTRVSRTSACGHGLCMRLPHAAFHRWMPVSSTPRSCSRTSLTTRTLQSCWQK